MERPSEEPKYTYQQLIKLDSVEIIDAFINIIDAEIKHHARYKDASSGDTEYHNRLLYVRTELSDLISALGKNRVVVQVSRENIQKQVMRSAYLFQLLGGES